MVRYEMLIDKRAAHIIKSSGASKELKKIASGDYGYRLSQVQYIRDVLEPIDLLKDGQIDLNLTLDESHSAKLVRFFRANVKRHEIVFGKPIRSDFRTKSFRQLGELLKKVGLKLDKPGKTSRKGASVYRYKIEAASYAELHSIYELRNPRANVDEAVGSVDAIPA